jgi:hypothetical protein
MEDTILDAFTKLKELNSKEPEATKYFLYCTPAMKEDAERQLKGTNVEVIPWEYICDNNWILTRIPISNLEFYM